MTRRWLHLGMAAAMTGMLACGSDVSAPDGGPPLANLGGGSGGTDSTGGTGGGTGGGQTSNGPAVKLVVTPHAISIPTGNYAIIAAIGLDASNIRVVKKATFTSSDANIVVAADSGIVYGKAAGTAKVFVTLDAFKDTVTVVVTPGPPPPPPPTPPVAEFNMTVVAFGRMPGTDTSHTERVGGSTITLTRVGTVTGDTLNPSIPAGSATADANGEAKFSKLIGGFYTIKIVPPAGSPYTTTQSGIGAPREKDITVHVTLQRP